MKNMTSPAKNCSILLCALLLMAAGCKKDDPVPLPEDLHGNVERPTWSAPEVTDMTSSMTAVIKVEKLNDQMLNDSIVNEADLLAAFSGETCLGTAPLQDGLFFLYIASPTSYSDSGLTSNSEAVTLRYYSAHYKNLFEAKDAFYFHNDDRLGTVAAPIVPSFVVVK